MAIDEIRKIHYEQKSRSEGKLEGRKEGKIEMALEMLKEIFMIKNNIKGEYP